MEVKDRIENIDLCEDCDAAIITMQRPDDRYHVRRCAACAARWFRKVKVSWVS